jgi:KamA family protein
MTQTSTLSRPVAKAVDNTKLKFLGQNDLENHPKLARLDPEQRFAMKVVSSVLPFRTNEYIVDQLIDWSNIPDDPIFQLTFPQQGMLLPEHYQRVASLYQQGASKDEIKSAAQEIRMELNPHPAGQMQLNTPLGRDGEAIEGLQHKYRETVLFFPSPGQTCHAFCSFCFRWPQFVGDKTLKIATSEASRLHGYLRDHKTVSDLLITGGDPMVMKTKHLKQYLEPLKDPTLEHVQTLRLGTKALTFWPQRFVTDPDADELLYLLEDLVASGKHVALMAHYNHWREMDTEIAERAIKRIQDTGAIIRSQGPLLAHINDNADDWRQMWSRQIGLNIVPYYMFVERDTGARHYFEVPLYRAWEIYRDAMRRISGLGRTARGPSMSAGPGKIEIQGVTEINGEKVFALRFIQGRSSEWVQRPFFAKYDEKATWLNHLKPVFGEEKFFFEEEYEKICSVRGC